MDKQPDLSVIILNYNMSGLLKHCLQSIFSHTYDHRLEIIVVDNGSNDNCEQVVTANFPLAKFIQTGANLGHAKGNNTGIRSCAGRHIMLLNPDTVFLTPIFDQLIDLLDQQREVGIATVQLCNPDRSVQTGAWRFPSLFVPIFLRIKALRQTKLGQDMIAHYEMHDWDRQQTKDVDWVQGSCLTIRREALDEIGLLDETFFLYFTDVDWCRRAWQAGWIVRYFAGPQLIHYYHRESADVTGWRMLFSKASRLHIRDWLRYLRKYFRQPHPRQP